MLVPYAGLVHLREIVVARIQLDELLEAVGARVERDGVKTRCACDCADSLRHK